MLGVLQYTHCRKIYLAEEATQEKDCLDRRGRPI